LKVKFAYYLTINRVKIMTEKEIVQELKEAHTLISNGASHPGIQKKLTDFGVAPKFFKEGQTLADNLTTLQRQISTLYGYQHQATKTIRTDYEALKVVYEQHLTLARLACEGQCGLQTSLRLKGRRAHRRAEWTEQLAQFYEKLLEQPQLLERYNVTLAELEHAQSMVIAFEEAQRTQTKKKGEAQRNTRQRNEARKKLKKWVTSCKKFAQAALEDDKELLEVLGMVVPQRKNTGAKAASTTGEVASLPPQE
jgi:hypothetical protein